MKQTRRNSTRSLVYIGSLLAIFGLLLIISRQERKTAEALGNSEAGLRSGRGGITAEFREVYSRYRDETTKSPVPDSLLELAAERRVQMLRWMERDPERALAEAVSWSEYEALPGELRPFFEKPFNRLANLRVLPVCGADHPTGEIRLLEMDGRTWDASVYGSRNGNTTKENSPLAGITLDGRAAIREFALERIEPSDIGIVSSLPLANPDPTRGFLTGEPLGASPVVAVAGGKRFLFASPAALEKTNVELAAYDATPGPHGGSSVLFEPKAIDDEGRFSLILSEGLVSEEASNWTETPKDVFFIRIDFPDQAGEVVSQSALSHVLNNAVADSITEMSYGKTTINAAVSSTTVRMPNPKTFYLPSNNDALHTDAMNAYRAIAGPSSLDAYDIVGVHFGSIGITSGGLNYAGLAGGSRQWLQGNTNTGVIIHEFGHNYGIGHASFWDTSDGSVVGTGANEEYGDIFDIMGDGPDPEGHFHMQAKQKLNWIDGTQWADASATGSGTYRIYRFDDPATTGSLRGLRITKASSPGEYYWLGLRSGIASNNWLKKGGYLIWQRPNQTRSWLLDTTPDSPANKDDAPVTVGLTYSDTSAGIHLTPIAQGGSGADAWLDVNVQLGSFPGNQAPIATLISPASASARTSVAFSVNATDPNGDPLAYSWDFGDSTVSDNTPSISHTWAVGGTYDITVTISDMKGGKVTKTASITISDPLDAWYARTSNTTEHLNDIALGAGKLVAVGEGRGTYRVSTNGLTWTGGTVWVSGDTGYNLYLTGVIHDGTKFVASGYDYNFSDPLGWTGVVYTSPDGISWTRRHFLGEELRDIAYGGGNYVAVGDAGTAWHSTDGLAWSPVPTGVTRDLDGVAFGGGVFVAVGYENNVPGVILTSSNGNSWIDTSSGTSFGNSQGFYDIEWCNDRFLASGWYGRLRNSTDGGASFTTNLTDYHRMAGLTYGNGVYFAAGVNQSSSNADTNLISTDGTTWTPLTTASQPDRNAAVFFNDTFITVADDGAIRQSAAFTGSTANNYATWLEDNFPGAPTLSGETDDFDFDGFPNLAEYAMGSDPRDGTSPAPLLAVRNGNMLEVDVPKSPSATGVSHVAQRSSDLVLWTSEGVTISDESANGFTMAIPVSSLAPGRGFMRVAYTLDP